jgi:hypothetical protein
MKLKLVVASMSLLGLITCAYADTQTKHKTHHKTRHHRMMTQTQSYKGEVPIIQPMVMDCQIDWYQPMLDGMSQNAGRAKPTVDCHKPLTFAGGLNFDYHFGNLSQGYNGENTEKFSVNDAYINAFGNVNQWARAFASLSYNNASGTSFNSPFFNTNGSANGVRNNVMSGEYSSAYNRTANGTNRLDTVHMEQAYLTLGDLNQMPVFFQFGKQFEDFGRYQIHPLTRTLTQSMTETLRTSANVGFVTRMGLHGSAFAFDNGLRKNTATTPTAGDSHSRYAYGLSVGFDQPCDTLGYDLGIGYLTDMIGANDVQQAVVAYRTNTLASTTNTFVNRVGSVALYADLNSGPFDVGARYTTALQRFNVVDLPTTAAATQGAKPWSADIKAGYNYNAWNYGQNLYVGYQQTGGAVFLNLPSNRWLIGFGVDVYKNTNIGIELDHDSAYSKSKGGTGTNSNLVGVRAAVKFG